MEAGFNPAGQEKSHQGTFFASKSADMFSGMLRAGTERDTHGPARSALRPERDGTKKGGALDVMGTDVDIRNMHHLRHDLGQHDCCRPVSPAKHDAG